MMIDPMNLWQRRLGKVSHADQSLTVPARKQSREEGPDASLGLQDFTERIRCPRPNGQGLAYVYYEDELGRRIGNS
jgi:hypothetical protein